jgi:hypothetical protein
MPLKKGGTTSGFSLVPFFGTGVSLFGAKSAPMRRFPSAVFNTCFLLTARMPDGFP